MHDCNDIDECRVGLGSKLPRSEIGEEYGAMQENLSRSRSAPVAVPVSGIPNRSLY